MKFSLCVYKNNTTRKLLQNMATCCGGFSVRSQSLYTSCYLIDIDLDPQPTATGARLDYLHVCEHAKVLPSPFSAATIRAALRIVASKQLLNRRVRTDHIDSVVAGLFEHIAHE